jgi:BON domain
MKINSNLKMAFLVISLMLAFNAISFAQRNDCAKTTDDQIVDAIYKKLEKSKYKDQTNHINVRSKDGVVTVEGWTTDDKAKLNIIKIVKKIKCVKSVVAEDLTIGVGGGCAAGQKECGEVCIPVAEKCNIRTKGN